MIVQRTLNTVGGYRPRSVRSIRSLNRKARALGFRSYAAYIARLTQDKLFRENIERMLAEHHAAQVEGPAA